MSNVQRKGSQLSWVANKASGLVLIEDQARVRAAPLWKHVLHTSIRSVRSKQNRHLWILTFDHSPSHIASLCESMCHDNAVFERIGILDCYTDPLGWKAEFGTTSTPESSSTTTSSRIQTTCCRDVMSIELIINGIRRLLDGCNRQDSSSSSSSVSILIDSISCVMRLHGPSQTCRLLAALTQLPHSQVTVKSVIAVVHSDLHIEQDLRMLEYTAGSHVKVDIAPYGREEQIDGLLRILQKRPSGKVSQATELYRLDSESGLRVIEKHDVKVFKNEGSHAWDPSVAEKNQSVEEMGLTFKLTLTDQQRQAKDRVDLPYTHHIATTDNIGNNGNSGGITIRNEADDIHSTSTSSRGVGGDGGQYQGGVIYLETNDEDWDDEDPDDDLDI